MAAVSTTHGPRQDAGASDEIDLAALLGTLFDHKWLIGAAIALGFALSAARDLADAMAQAGAALGAQGGVVLLSPGAPSYGPYRDYVARGRHFAELAGFDPDRISAIAGIGIA